MSRRTLLLSAAQRTFLDEAACKQLAAKETEDGSAGRPLKRRKIGSEDDEWAAILEFTIQCQLVDNSLSSLHSTSAATETSTTETAITFDDPVLSISNPQTDDVLFAFVCGAEDAEVVDKITWYQTLAHKDASISSCLRCLTSTTFRQRQGSIEQAAVSFIIEIRFDNNLLRVSKLSLKDRLSIIESAYEQPRESVTAEQFYADVGKLPKNDENREFEETLQHPSLSCRLFPFQKRAIGWMLRRERYAPSIRPITANSDTRSPEELPPLWETATDLSDRTIYINRYQGFLTLNEAWVFNSFIPRPILGGILAEVRSSSVRFLLQEMGLGKTIEMIDLILINPMPSEVAVDRNGVTESHSLRSSKATIIITPPTICISNSFFWLISLKYRNGKESSLKRLRR